MLNLLFSLLLFLMAFPVIAQWGDVMLPIQQELYDTPAEGYIFQSVFKLDTVGDYPSNVSILDSAGNYIFFAPLTTQTQAPFSIHRGTTNFELQPSGDMSFAQRTNNKMQFHTMDSTFNIVQSYVCLDSNLVDIHEFAALPNGDIIMMCVEQRVVDLSALTTNGGSPGDSNAIVIGNVIQRFDSNGILEFEWNTIDAFSLKDTYMYNFNNANQLDHAHVNAFEIDDDGHYMVSSRNLSEITKIDRNTGQIIWRLGGKNSDFTFVGDTVPFSVQHDIRRLANGNITLFDNAAFSSTPICRGIEYKLDTVNWTATMVWEFKNPFGSSSRFIGSCRRLPNGNTIIGWGGASPYSQTISVSEIDPNGNIVMDLDLPDRYFSYRAPKTTLPFTLPQPTIDYDGFELVAPIGYISYLWSTGETTSSIVPADTGTYTVWVNQGIGYIISHPYKVIDLDILSGPDIVAETNANSFKLFPNPATDVLTIELSSTLTKWEQIRIYDALGRPVKVSTSFSASTRTLLDISKLTPGIYVVAIGSDRQKFSKQ